MGWVLASPGIGKRSSRPRTGQAMEHRSSRPSSPLAAAHVLQIISARPTLLLFVAGGSPHREDRGGVHAVAAYKPWRMRLVAAAA